jgi:hypothetical protein
MNKALMWLTIVIVVLVGGKMGLTRMFRAGEEHRAHERVDRILAGLKPGGDVSRAICMWAEGTVCAGWGQEAFNRAADAFEAWSGTKKLKSVAEFEITEVTLESEGALIGEGVALVTASVNGQELSMRVAQGKPVEWAD